MPATRASMLHLVRRRAMSGHADSVRRIGVVAVDGVARVVVQPEDGAREDRVVIDEGDQPRRRASSSVFREILGRSLPGESGTASYSPAALHSLLSQRWSIKIVRWLKAASTKLH